MGRSWDMQDALAHALIYALACNRAICRAPRSPVCCRGAHLEWPFVYARDHPLRQARPVLCIWRVLCHLLPTGSEPLEINIEPSSRGYYSQECLAGPGKPTITFGLSSAHQHSCSFMAKSHKRSKGRPMQLYALFLILLTWMVSSAAKKS